MDDQCRPPSGGTQAARPTIGRRLPGQSCAGSLVQLRTLAFLGVPEITRTSPVACVPCTRTPARTRKPHLLDTTPAPPFHAKPLFLAIATATNQ
eukprot:scaffold3299_cov116-Isochrysis_galbana.AAC.8